MPFKSKAQRKWMHKNKPTMAKKWEKKTPKGSKLPKKVKKKRYKDGVVTGETIGECYEIPIGRFSGLDWLKENGIWH